MPYNKTNPFLGALGGAAQGAMQAQNQMMQMQMQRQQAFEQMQKEVEYKGALEEQKSEKERKSMMNAIIGQASLLHEQGDIEGSNHYVRMSQMMSAPGTKFEDVYKIWNLEKERQPRDLPINVESTRDALADEMYGVKYSKLKTPDQKKSVNAAWEQQQIRIAGGKAAAAQAERPVAAEMAGKLGELEVLVSNMEEVAKLYSPEYVGKTGGTLGSVREFTGYIDPEEVTFRKIIADAQDALLRARSGAQINEQEYRRLKNFLPKLWDQPEVFKPALERFYKNLVLVRDKKLKYAITPRKKLSE